MELFSQDPVPADGRNPAPDYFQQQTDLLRLAEEGRLKHIGKKPQNPLNCQYPLRNDTPNMHAYNCDDNTRRIQQQKDWEQHNFQNDLLLHQNVHYNHHQQQQAYTIYDPKSHQPTINNYQIPAVPAIKDQFDCFTNDEPAGHNNDVDNGECESQPAPAMYQSQPSYSQSEYFSLSNPDYTSNYTADIPSYSEATTSVDYYSCPCDSSTFGDD